MSRIFAKLEIIAGCVLLAVITVLVFIAAVMRFVGYPLIWSVDLAQLLFIWLCFFGAAKAMRERSHLGVDFLTRLLPPGMRLVLETLMSLLFAAFFLVLAWEGYKLTMLNKERLFGDSGLSYAWVTIAVPAGCLLLLGSMISNLIEAWRGRITDGRYIYSRAMSPVEAGEIEDI
ncbi:TRAP transporter small permease [uncultured Roseibium sp.]|uniref:TRAP transporter small permease n=1 Tax=uncultured Roseibium sp. TaxID=1936171 RepID=UPI0032162A5D